MRESTPAHYLFHLCSSLSATAAGSVVDHSVPDGTVYFSPPIFIVCDGQAQRRYTVTAHVRSSEEVKEKDGRESLIVC